MMNELDAGLLITVGAQGTASIAMIRQLLHTLMKKNVLQRFEVVTTLELTAEAVERQKDELGGMYVQATSTVIRQLCAEFQDEPRRDRKH
jgi:hypothetical protein